MTDLPAGRDLDALIAEKVMGWTITAPNWGHREIFPPFDPPEDPDDQCTSHSVAADIPHYSTDISAAWEAVETMGYRPFSVFSSLVSTGPAVDGKIPCRWEWFCYFDDPAFPGQAETAPLAICRAALKTVGHKDLA